jgi:hypothetical protein
MSTSNGCYGLPFENYLGATSTEHLDLTSDWLIPPGFPQTSAYMSDLQGGFDIDFLGNANQIELDRVETNAFEPMLWGSNYQVVHLINRYISNVLRISRPFQSEKLYQSITPTLPRPRPIWALRNDPIARQNAGLVIEALSSFPYMMKRHSTFPSFIHRHCHRADQLPDALVNCTAIAKLFAIRNDNNREEIWTRIAGEQSHFLENVYSSSKEDLLAQTQAELIYMIMKFVDDASPTPDIHMHMVTTYQVCIHIGPRSQLKLTGLRRFFLKGWWRSLESLCLP